MIFPKAKKIAKELNWFKTTDGVFGLYKNYFFNITDSSLFSSPQYKFVTATVDNLTEEQTKCIITELDSNKKELKFTNYEINQNRISFVFTENLTYTKIKTIYALFDFLVTLFIKLNVAEQNKCHNSGEKESIDFYNLNETGVILSSKCFQDIKKEYEKIENKRKTSGKNHIAGFLGSIIFSIPGIIIWVLVAIYLERLASAMSIVIAFFALKGYEYFKGQESKWKKYLIVVSNIISIVVANIATVTFMLVNQGFSIGEAFTEFQVNQNAIDIFKQNTLISFILAFFVWIWLLFAIKENKFTIKKAEKIESK